MTLAAKGARRALLCDDSVAPRYLRPRREHLRAAMKRLDVEANDLAIDWQCHHSYVGAVLRGEKAWPEERVAQLSLELRMAMAEEECRDLHMLVGRKAALIDALAALNALAREDEPLRPRMARMDLLDADEPKGKVR